MNHTDALQDAGILADAHEKPHVSVPIVRATAESLIVNGTLVSDFQAEEILSVSRGRSRADGGLLSRAQEIGRLIMLAILDSRLISRPE